VDFCLEPLKDFSRCCATSSSLIVLHPKSLPVARINYFATLRRGEEIPTDLESEFKGGFFYTTHEAVAHRLPKLFISVVKSILCLFSTPIIKKQIPANPQPLNLRGYRPQKALLIQCSYNQINSVFNITQIQLSELRDYFVICKASNQ